MPQHKAGAIGHRGDTTKAGQLSCFFDELPKAHSSLNVPPSVVARLSLALIVGVGKLLAAGTTGAGASGKIASSAGTSLGLGVGKAPKQLGPTSRLGRSKLAVSRSRKFARIENLLLSSSRVAIVNRFGYRAQAVFTA